LFVLASIAVIYPAWPFFTAAWRALKNGVLNMAVLVVLSVGTGYVFSVDATISTVDGITVEYPDWWFNLRPSNTEPVAKLVIEAASTGQLAQRQAELLALFAGEG